LLGLVDPYPSHKYEKLNSSGLQMSISISSKISSNVVQVAEVMAISADDLPVFDPENRLLSSEYISAICTSFIIVYDPEEHVSPHTRLRRVERSAEISAELSKPERTVGLSHLSIKDFLTTLPILNRKELSFSNAATETVARSVIVKGCLAYILHFGDATPVMMDLMLLREYPLLSYIYGLGQDLINSISEFNGDSALCQLLAELFARRPTSLFELLDWDKTWDNLRKNSYNPGRVPLKQHKIRQPLSIAGELRWTHAAKGLVRASANGNYPTIIPVAQLSESEQAKVLCAAAGHPTSLDHVMNYILEDLVRMPDSCCEVELSYPTNQLQKVKKTMADSVLDNGPDDAAVRQFLYSDAAGRFLLKHSKGGWFAGLFTPETSHFIQTTLFERYGKTTKDGNNEDDTPSRSLPLTRSAKQGKASSDNFLQGPGTIHGSLLHAAAFPGRFTMLEDLADKGADVNLRIKPHLTAFHAAASTPYYSCLLLLLDRGADIHATLPTHGSVLSVVSTTNDYSTINMLLERGANVNAMGEKHGCAITAATANGKGAALLALIAKCPDWTTPNERGQTAWEIADEYAPPPLWKNRGQNTHEIKIMS